MLTRKFLSLSGRETQTQKYVYIKVSLHSSHHWKKDCCKLPEEWKQPFGLTGSSLYGAGINASCDAGLDVGLLSYFTLLQKFEAKLMPEECFSPLDLFNKIQEQNEELGLIIDLTYTQRYYKVEVSGPLTEKK